MNQTGAGWQVGGQVQGLHADDELELTGSGLSSPSQTGLRKSDERQAAHHP